MLNFELYNPTITFLGKDKLQKSPNLFHKQQSLIGVRGGSIFKMVFRTGKIGTFWF